MPRIAIIDLATEQILTTYEDEAPNQEKFGGPWGWPHMTVHMCIPENFQDPNILRVVPGHEQNTFTFEVDADKQAAKIARQWTVLREERNRRLGASDWTRMDDAPLTPEARSMWAVYRQALRNLPGNTTNPAAPIWPTPP